MSWANAPKQDLSCLAPPSSCGEVPLFSLTSLQVHKPCPAAEQSEEGAPSLGEAPAKAEVRKEFRFYLLLLGSHKRGILSRPDPRSCATDLSGTAPDRMARQSSKPDASTTPGHGSRTLSAPGSQGAPVLSEPP